MAGIIISRNYLNLCLQNFDQLMAQNIPKLQLPTKLDLDCLHKLPLVSLNTPQTLLSPKKEVNDMLKTKLGIIASTQEGLYTSKFIGQYLLVKVNELAQARNKKFHAFLPHLCQFYNAYVSSPHPQRFRKANNDSELLAQILLSAQLECYLEQNLIDQLLDQGGLVVTSMANHYFDVQLFLKKSELVVTLSLSSLFARHNPYISCVHQEKNHKGQTHFAAQIYELFHLDPTVEKPVLDMVQDAYSLRCAPQVHGVVYDVFQELKQQLSKSLNKPQSRQLEVKGIKIRNLGICSSTQTLLLDSLVCALNEVGHMSFLRSERMLNQKLTKNSIQKSKYHDLLLLKLKKESYRIAQNKALAAPTNAETIIMDNYRHDIYANEGKPETKTANILQNIKELMKTQVLTAVEVLNTVYGQPKRLFVNNKLQDLYKHCLLMREEGGFEKLLRWVDEWFER